MVRSILAVLAGIAVGIALIFFGHFLWWFIFPPPPGLDWNDQEAVAVHASTLPDSAFVLVLLTQAMGPLGGGFVAAWRIARRARVVHGLIVGAFFLVVGIVETSYLAHPHWFTYAEALMYLPAAYAGVLLAPRKRAAAAPAVSA
jgi:hypothetical protein